MKKTQWIVIVSAVLLLVFVYRFVSAVPPKKALIVSDNQQHTADDGHDHGTSESSVTIDTILVLAKKQLKPDQVIRLNMLENSISRGDVKNQQLAIYHQLSHFWRDSAHIFEPYAWYEAESARLENSEKTLTFAARLFLDNLQNDESIERRQWKAMQAKDLFERSLMINPDNDSAKVGVGACYLFGNISATPMEGISKIREVVQRDSSNIYAQMMLVKGSLLSGQYDKAIARLQTVIGIEPENIEANLLMADMYERKADKANAILWYQKSLSFIKPADIRTAIAERIEELKK